jgi:hypothetical protein
MPGMAKALSTIEQIFAVSRMVHRTHIHLALWKLTAGVEGRSRHREVLDEHWEHLRFLEHGQLVTAVVELHSLLDANERTINLPRLLDEVEAQAGPQPQIREALSVAQPDFSRVRTLRNSAYAHRTKRRAFPDIFKAAQLTPDQLQGLILTGINVANELRVVSACHLRPRSRCPWKPMSACWSSSGLSR